MTPAMDQLGDLVRVSQMYGCKQAAVFFADKIVAMQPGKHEHRYALASLFFAQGEFRRALAELNVERDDEMVLSTKDKLLATRCLVYGAMPMGNRPIVRRLSLALDRD